MLRLELELELEVARLFFSEEEAAHVSSLDSSLDSSSFYKKPSGKSLLEVLNTPRLRRVQDAGGSVLCALCSVFSLSLFLTLSLSISIYCILYSIPLWNILVLYIFGLKARSLFWYIYSSTSTPPALCARCVIPGIVLC